MTKKVSTMEVRARIGDLLNRVALRHDEFIIERKGKPLAALVPVERLEQMRQAARLGFTALLERQKRGPGSQLTERQALDLALAAQREVRPKPRAARRPPKSKRARK